MDKKSNIFLIISIIINALLIFFGMYIGNLYIIQAIALAFAILSIKLSKVKIKHDTMIWLLFLLCLLIFTITSIDIVVSIKAFSLVFMAVSIKILYENNNSDWSKYYLNLIFVFSGIHVLATILQLINPNVIYYINSYIMPADSLKINQDLYNVGGYAGITAQTSVNAFYITIFLGISFLKVLYFKENRKVNIIFLLISILALFITGKRGMLIFSCLTLVLMLIYILKGDNKKARKYIFLLFVIFIIGYIIISNIPQASITFEKIKLLKDNDEIMNGRDILWSKTLKIFKENMLLGIGFGTIKNMIGDYTHNVYLQLLAETGIIGTIIYILAILISFKFSMQKTKNVLKYGNVEQKINTLFSLFMQMIFILYCFSGNPLYGQYFIIPYMISIAVSTSINVGGDKI